MCFLKPFFDHFSPYVCGLGMKLNSVSYQPIRHAGVFALLLPLLLSEAEVVEHQC